MASATVTWPRRHRAVSAMDSSTMDSPHPVLICAVPKAPKLEEHHLFMSRSASLGTDTNYALCPHRTDPIRKKISRLNVKQQFLRVHDPLQLEITKEYETVQLWNAEVKSHDFTIDVLRQALQSQPPILHITHHAYYDSEEKTFHVDFDRTPAMCQLLEANGSFMKGSNRMFYRDYFTVLALYAEEEMDPLIHPSNNRLYRVIDATHPLFDYPQIKELMQNTARRFGCGFFVREQAPRRIEIQNGVIRHNENGQRERHEPNRHFLDHYRVSAICQSPAVKRIMSRVNQLYQQLLQVTPYQANVQGRYSWALLSQAIWNVFPKEIWQALTTERMLNMTTHSADECKGDEYIPNQSDDNSLWTAFASTYLLEVEPRDLDSYQDADQETQATTQIQIADIIRMIQNRVRGTHQIAKGVVFMSSPDDHVLSNTLHRRLIHFTNSTAEQRVRSEVIDPLRKKYGAFNIELISLRKSDPTAYRQCGYIPMNETKKIKMDTMHGMDDISRMIRNELKSMAQCNIKLLLLMGCYSHHLAMVFQPFVEHIICIHPHCEIEDEYTIRFSHYLYEKLAEYKKKGTFKNVPRAFDEALERLTADIDMLEVEPPECMQDGDDESPHFWLRISRVHSMEKCEEFEQYVYRRLMPTRFHKSSTSTMLQMTPSPSASTECSPADSNRKYTESGSSSISPFVPRMDAMNYDHILPSFEWYHSVIPTHSYTIVKCTSQQQRNEVMKILQQKQREELEAFQDIVITPKWSAAKLKQFLLRKAEEEKRETGTNAPWYVTECCCTEDVPHRVRDKFVLVKGQEIPKLVQSQSLPMACVETPGLSPGICSNGAKTLSPGLSPGISPGIGSNGISFQTTPLLDTQTPKLSYPGSNNLLNDSYAFVCHDSVDSRNSYFEMAD